MAPPPDPPPPPPPPPQSIRKSKRRSKGRQKIQMKLIENENSRGTTFSKRRVGIFKKATELSTLCGAKIGIIIFSIGGKPYSFGLDYVLSAFYRLPPPPPAAGAGEDAIVKDLKEKSDKLMEETEIIKKKRMEMHENLRTSPNEISDAKFNGLNLVELKMMKQKMESMREKIKHRIELGCSTENNPNPGGGKVYFGKVQMDERDASKWLKL